MSKTLSILLHFNPHIHNIPSKYSMDSYANVLR